MSDFTRRAIQAGFSQEQAAFLDTMLAKFPHGHEIEEVEGLEERLEEIEEGEDGDEEDDD